MRCTDLEADDEVEEEDHVDDAVDDGLLDADDEEHGGAHQDPVLAAHVPHPMTWRLNHRCTGTCTAHNALTNCRVCGKNKPDSCLEQRCLNHRHPT